MCISSGVKTKATNISSGMYRSESHRTIFKLPFFITLAVGNNHLKVSLRNGRYADMVIHVVTLPVYEKWVKANPRAERQRSARSVWTVQVMVVPDIIVDRYIQRICENLSSFGFPDLGNPAWEEHLRWTGYLADFRDPQRTFGITCERGQAKLAMSRLAREMKNRAQQQPHGKSGTGTVLKLDSILAPRRSQVEVADPHLEYKTKHVIYRRCQLASCGCCLPTGVGS